MRAHRPRRQSPPPAAPVELVVETIGARGDGIAHDAGGPIFLPFTVAGDRVRAQPGPRRGDGREGRVVEWLGEGPGRVRPPCAHFGRCGGCTLQHLDAALYEAVKLAALGNALARAGIDPAPVGPLRRLATPARRRVRLGLARPAAGQPPRVGFRERFRHELVDLHECFVLDPALFAVVPPLRRHLGDLLAPGDTADATLTLTDSGVDLLIAGATPPGLGGLEALAELAAEGDLARIVWRGPGGDLPVVERRKPRLLLSGVPVALPPGGFVQASAAAEKALVAAAVQAIDTARPVVDLYAGLGAFAFACADGGSVHAVEGDAAAFAALEEAARQKPGLSVERRDLAGNPLLPAALDCFAAAIFDPPRAGAAAQAAALARSTVATVVAVSCNPATFARDARMLIDGGYRLERIDPVDQFAWTAHLELVAVFRRQKARR